MVAVNLVIKLDAVNAGEGHAEPPDDECMAYRT
jgi:hypothetical protein